MNWLSRAAFALFVVSAITGFVYPAWSILAAITAISSSTILWITREVGHRNNVRLRAKVVQLGGHLEGLDIRVKDGHPLLNTAAAFIGQGELATWNYPALVERMRLDGHIQ